jgi:hypothetical protein
MNRSSSPALRLGSATFVLVLATMFFGAGCGAATPPNAGFADAKMMPSVPGEAPPQNLGDAEAQFASAEQNVFGALGRDKRETQGQFAQPPGQIAQRPAPTTTATEASPPPPPRDGERDKDAEARAAMGAGSTAPTADSAAALSASPCETACRALASMDRSATHICSLAGDDSDHCSNARERVRSATERVRQSCSECSNG